MAVYCTAENKKDALLRKTLESLSKTVNFINHDFMISVNAMTKETEQTLFEYDEMIDNIIVNDCNIGTAKAINKIWKLRAPGQHCVKMDDDVIINHVNWADEMEEAIKRQKQIGIIGLKRKDLIECTTHPDQNYRSVLYQLPHNPGERWIVVEIARGIMGTCQMVNSDLIDRIGYLWQPTLYGFDDSMYSCRSHQAGFINCFLPHINIDHIDPGGTGYQSWKERHAGETIMEAERITRDYMEGRRPLYEEA